eukprot:CAMPEP_0197196436 /NCGR_PEP_ID=MMETSP1423-20130617/32353_1 /TAXON_ID=476441 /ORGANISM="Pseudo-nitzschia heimii, Strain UNC1101" /LENGTH=378 /DNA_ID=CAMNT_0042650235 /DNA_START=120 /DNA_END=1256 /DNA_ORIENTATION=+
MMIPMSPVVIGAAESSLAGGGTTTTTRRILSLSSSSSSSAAARLAVFFLLLFLLFAPAAAGKFAGGGGGGGGGNSVESDPPQTTTPPPSLPIDIAGQWMMTSFSNCHAYKAAVLVYTGVAPDLDSFMVDRNLRSEVQRLCRKDRRNIGHFMWIFQDCLESTTTDGRIVHHMISDGTSKWVDWMYDLPMEWVSTIETPLEEEALEGAMATMTAYPIDPVTKGVSTIETPLEEEALDGATATMALYTIDPVTKERFYTNPEDAGVRRYVNSHGELVVTRDPSKFTASSGGNATTTISTRGKFIHELVSVIPGCPTNWSDDPDSCADRVYTDTTLNWTVACCEISPGGDDFFDSLLSYPRPDYYEGDRAHGIADCDVPTDR